MGNFLRDAAKFIICISSLWGSGQVLEYTYMYAVLGEVSRQPWVWSSGFLHYLFETKPLIDLRLFSFLSLLLVRSQSSLRGWPPFLPPIRPCLQWSSLYTELVSKAAVALLCPMPSSAPKPSLPSVPRLKTALNCLMIRGRGGKVTWRETYTNVGFPLFSWNCRVCVSLQDPCHASSGDCLS